MASKETFTYYDVLHIIEETRANLTQELQKDPASFDELNPGFSKAIDAVREAFIIAHYGEEGALERIKEQEEKGKQLSAKMKGNSD